MNSKKAITLLVLATLLLSLTPLVMTNAIDIDSVLDEDYNIIVGSVYYGDIIIVQGSGATPGRNVNVYWDSIDDWDAETGSGLLNSTKAEGNGDYEVWLEVPEALNGAHYISVENVRNGETDTWTTAIDVGASLKLSPSSGLIGDEVTITGRGFGDEVEIDTVQFNVTTVTTSPGTPETNELGTWTATFDVPSYTYWDDHIVYAEDEDGNSATKSFKIGASITLNKVEGPAGTVVRISGRGFTADAEIAPSGSITFNGVDCLWLDDSVVVRDNQDRTFTIDVVIPDTTPLDEYPIIVSEGVGGAGLDAEADFEILGHPEIEVSPEYGPVGSTVTVRGYNFTQISGEEVILELNGLGDKEVETDGDGTFEATFRIPGAAGTSVLSATQADYNIDATTNFRVGFITVVLSPNSGPSGTEVSVSGAGFDDTDDWNATFAGDTWIEDQGVGTGGVISDSMHVPSMEAGTYEVVITEVTSGISVTVEYTLTENTYIETNPLVAPPGYNVDIMGYNFAENPGDDSVEFVLYNETDEWELDVEYDGQTLVLMLDEDWDTGYFEGNFTLPDEDELSLGTYWLNVTDQEGMFAQLTLEIVDETVDIEPRKSVFRITDTVAFNVESSFAQRGSYIQVYDPTGELYWETDDFASSVWVKVGTVQVVPYYAQVAGGNPMILLDDAPIGTWSWSWFNDEDDELDSGTFSVEASPESELTNKVTDLANQLTDLQDDVSGISDEFDDIRSNLDEVRSVAQQAVSAAQQAEEAIQTVAQTANQANQAASDAKEAAEAARDAANGLTTLVYGAIGAALVAALAAIVSLMQISRRIAG
jgi:hypothetical protein